MKNLNKAAKMAALAFTNGIRLHKDSILLFENSSFATAYFLSILAQEEIGKAFLLEEHVFQMRGRINEIDSINEKILLETLISHRAKQGWFSRIADDIHKYHGKKYPRFVKEISTGKMEEKKQNAIYVGITKKNGKFNIKGKLVIPNIRLKSMEAKNQITRVNDFLIILIEEVYRGISIVDTDELNNVLDMETSLELEKKWPYKTKDTQNKLAKMLKVRYSGIRQIIHSK